MPGDGNSQNNEKYVTEEQVKSICKDFMDEYLAENKEEIQSTVIEAVKSDIERIVIISIRMAAELISRHLPIQVISLIRPFHQEDY